MCGGDNRQQGKTPYAVRASANGVAVYETRHAAWSGQQWCQEGDRT